MNQSNKQTRKQSGTRKQPENQSQEKPEAQPNKQSVQLVWLKKDLRLRDHRPLQVAAETNAPVLLFYLFEPSVMADSHHSNRHWTFVWESLLDMRQKLASTRLPLWVLKMEALDFFHRVDETFDIQHILSHEETGLDVTYQRDLAVARWCKKSGVMWKEYASNGVYRGLQHRNGWRKRWASRMALPLYDPDLAALTGANLPESLAAMQVTMDDILVAPTGASEAHRNEARDAASPEGVTSGKVEPINPSPNSNSYLHTSPSSHSDSNFNPNPNLNPNLNPHSDSNPNLNPHAHFHQTQIGGEEEAWRTLESFLADRCAEYSASISAPGPARVGCSRMSPYITWGNISIKQIQRYVAERGDTGARGETGARGSMTEREDTGARGSMDAQGLDSSAKAGAKMAAATSTGKRGVRSFQSRLGWHCHFIQKLEAEPRMEFENLNRGYDDLRQEKNAALLKAWEEGQTGYPMVDASMRSLNTTGYLNFRMRAMLVSFLTHHLWLDWRDGSPHLARQFLDFEPGIHFSQLQMQAGTMGVNTIRIYNPVKQGKDHDPEGRFIREWVPELRGVPSTLLHEPWLMSEMEQMMAGCRIGIDYPRPIVADLKASYRRASDRLWAKKGDSLVKRENQRIMKTHVKKRVDGRANGA